MAIRLPTLTAERYYILTADSIDNLLVFVNAFLDQYQVWEPIGAVTFIQPPNTPQGQVYKGLFIQAVKKS